MPPRKGSSNNNSVEPPDRLTILPSGIITKILGHVPIREAVRTSILSRQWRYIWCSIPNLKFDNSCVKLPNNIDMLYEPSDSPFVSFVNRVLLLHQGPVHEFKISGQNYPKFSDINQWVTFVSRNGVEELYLQFGYFAKAPSSLFECSKLTALTLRFFLSLELPVGFEGFKSLKRLALKEVKIAIGSLEKLISGCPLLESLALLDSHSDVLNIHAPLLKYLNLKGEFEGFILEKTPHLKEITVTITNGIAELCNGPSRRSCTLIQFIDQFPLLQKFTGLGNFIKLSIDFEDPTEVRLLIRLMNSLPVLKELEIIGERHGSSSEGTDGSVWEFWSVAHNLGCHIFSKLKKVTVTASGSSDEIEFAKFVLLNSPTLETMKMVIPSSDIKDRRMKILVDLLRCRRASTKAEVVFCDS